MAKPDPAGVVVYDAGPLIHLDELNCLDLLRDFAEVHVPEAVWQEVLPHRPSALRRRRLMLQRRAELPKGDPELARLSDVFSLAAGEVESLRLMQQAGRRILLTDDAAARLVAERLGYEVHGTIGVVVRAIRRQQRTKRQVLNLLRAIPRRSTLFISSRLLNEIIEQVSKD